MLLYEFVIIGRHTTTDCCLSRDRSRLRTESNGHGSAPLIVHVDPIPVSTTAEQCMAEPDRPELDHVLFGVARDLIVRGDSPDLPRGWDRLRRQIRPGRRSFFTARASSERLTTDALDWWKSFAEGRFLHSQGVVRETDHRRTGLVEKFCRGPNRRYRVPHRSRRARHRLPPIESHGVPAIPSSSRFTPFSSSARSGRRVPRATSLLGVTGLAHVPRQHLADSHAPCRA